MVSSGLGREQQALVLRDLQPATAYELLVGAQNSVGQTEAKYKFSTLDLGGKQVGGTAAASSASSSSSSSSASSAAASFALLAGASSEDPLDPDDLDSDESLSRVDYIDETGARREVWLQQPAQLGQRPGQAGRALDSGGASLRWLALSIRQLLNSPLTLLLALCLLLVMLLLLLFTRFNHAPNQHHHQLADGAQSSNCHGHHAHATALASNPFKSAGGCMRASAHLGASANRRCSLDATTAALLEASEPPPSLTNGSSSLADEVSPARLNLAAGACNGAAYARAAASVSLEAQTCGLPGQQSYATPMVDCVGVSLGAPGAKQANFCRSLTLEAATNNCDQLESSASQYAVAGAGLQSSSGYGYASDSLGHSANYSTVQRSLTMDTGPKHNNDVYQLQQQQQHQSELIESSLAVAAAAAASGAHNERQQYLLQVLMGNAQQQQQHHQQQVATLGTLGRLGSTKSSLIQSLPMNQRPNSFVGAQQMVNEQVCPQSGAMTLGRLQQATDSSMQVTNECGSLFARQNFLQHSNNNNNNDADNYAAT